MTKMTSIARIALGALLMAYVLSLPFNIWLIYRLTAIERTMYDWSAVSQMVNQLKTSAVCDGISTPEAASMDVQRWQRVMVEMQSLRAMAKFDAHVAEQMNDFTKGLKVGAALHGKAQSRWVRKHCQQTQQLSALLSQAALEAAHRGSEHLNLGLNLALRDCISYLVVWAALAALLLFWVRRKIEQPIDRLARVMQRIAAGDWSADLPHGSGDGMENLVGHLKAAVDRFDRRDKLRIDKITQMRQLVRRLVVLVDPPVLIVGVDGTLQYANQASATAFGEPLSSIEGTSVTHWPGGQAVQQLIDDVLVADDEHIDGVIQASALTAKKILEHCVLIHDDESAVQRIVLVFKAQPGSWWRDTWSS